MDNEVRETVEPVNQKVTYTTTTVNIPEEYRPITMWGYFGYELLFLIPCIGFIILLVFAFGGSRNINVKNFARSYFCFLIIGAIIFAIVFIIFSILGIGAASYNYGISSYGTRF